MSVRVGMVSARRDNALERNALQTAENFLAMYEWIKALHVIAVISWMAGMLYLPRLFVYHTQVPIGSPQDETFKIMERRLLRAIMTPSMILTWLAGLYLVWAANWLVAGWFHAKFALVVVLSGIHGYLSRCVRNFANGQNRNSERFYRIINEVPAVLMVAIVILVIVKPF